jgi:capsular exopolysaccharide synthesis family protein
VIPQHDSSTEKVITESYRSLRTSLLFSRNRKQGNIILVTSSIPQEGKSTTATNLAKALAESGEPTLLVDFDLRRGCIHKNLRLYREPGLADYCSRDLRLDIVVQRTRFENMSAVASGKLPPNPPALIGSPSVERFFEECREQYTWIIVDAPPIASVTDSLLLAKLVDTVLVVVRHGEVDRKLARRCLNSLSKTEARLAGVLLNGVNPKQDSYHRYYGYYQDQPEPEGKVTRFRRSAVS